jgi:hypothetical protein
MYMYRHARNEITLNEIRQFKKDFVLCVYINLEYSYIRICVYLYTCPSQFEIWW